MTRLRWTTGASLPADVHDELLGPGAPYELARGTVAGRDVETFVRRPRSLRGLLDDAVRTFDTKPFLVSDDRTRTFAQAGRDVGRIAAVLAGDHGVRSGHRVAIAAGNSPEHALVTWAALSLGAIVVELNTSWTADELGHGLTLTEPVLIVGDEQQLARLDLAAVGPTPRCSTTDVVDRAASLLPVGPASVEEDHPALVLFTSGTTGRPKGAVLSHGNIINIAMATALGAAIARRLGPAPDPARVEQPVALVVSPLFHVSGMLAVLLTGPVSGAKLVFPGPARWDASRHLALTAEHRVSAWSGVPTQLRRLIRHPDLHRYDLSCLRRVSCGGAPFPPELEAAYRRELPGVTLSDGYGMSETVGLGTLNGLAQPTTEVEIRGAGGDVLAAGEVGEIHLRSPSVFLDYWNDYDATRAAVDLDGWYRTGDFGRVDGGRLHVESRRRDLILRGGENIYPIEIEHRLLAHPDIEDAAVIGVPHDDLGHEVKAIVVLCPGSDLTEADVQRWVAASLARFKVPAHVEVRASLPYNETGKVLKRELEPREEPQRAGRR